MAEPTWHVRLNDEVVGPMSEAELCDLARRGGIGADTPVSQDSSRWIEAQDVPGIVFCRARPSTIVNTQPNALNTSGLTIHPAWMFGGIALGIVGLMLLGFVGLMFVVAVTSPPNEAQREDPRSLAPATATNDIRRSEPEQARPIRYSSSKPIAPVSRRRKPVQAARLNLRWVDATRELMPLAQQLTPEQRAALGLVALASGADIYGARIYLTNTGNVPIRVYPPNLRIHFGGETAIVYTINDYRFLRPTVLQPGDSTSGLVTYTARMDIGAVIRTGGGEMSYQDPTIQVSYE